MTLSGGYTHPLISCSLDLDSKNTWLSVCNVLSIESCFNPLKPYTHEFSCGFKGLFWAQNGTEMNNPTVY